jgi:dCMP deaminase
MNALLREIKWLKSCSQLSKTFSTCAKRQYFAVILMPNGRVAGVGYNGSPPGMRHCVDGACPRFADKSPNGSSYDNCIAQHAEANAIVWSDPALRANGTLIVNGPPCFGCAKQIASSGISRVIFSPDESYVDWPKISQFFTSCGIELISIPENIYETQS